MQSITVEFDTPNPVLLLVLRVQCI